MVLMKEKGVLKRNSYRENIPLANKIYESIFGKPKTHQEWANSFNIKHKIIKELWDLDNV